MSQQTLVSSALAAVLFLSPWSVSGRELKIDSGAVQESDTLGGSDDIAVLSLTGGDDQVDEAHGILYDDENNIVSLDLSNQGLTTQQLQEKLSELDVEGSLHSLNVSGNRLTGTLDISHLRDLWFLDCSENQLSNIVFSNNEELAFANPYGVDCSGNEILWLPAGHLSDPADWSDTKEYLKDMFGWEWLDRLPEVKNNFRNQSVSLSVNTDQDTFDFRDEVPGMIVGNLSLSGIGQSELINCNFYSGKKNFTYSEKLINGQSPVDISGTLTVTRAGGNHLVTSKPVAGEDTNQPLLPVEIVNPLDPSVPGTVTDLQQNAGSANAYRLYNPNSGEHFYTEDLVERDYLIKIGWRDEGVGWIAPKLSTVPVYRLYNKNAGDHHYTVSIEERDELKRLGWKDEGIGWYSDEGKSVPLLRQYNPNAKAGSHNYTPDQFENDFLVKVGWRPEGIAWYGLPGSERN